MYNQIRPIAGVAILLALALAGALGIFLYSAAQPLKADEHSATRSFNPDPVAPGGSVVVTIGIDNDLGAFGRVTETLPADFTYVSKQRCLSGLCLGWPGDHSSHYSATPDNITYTVTAPMDAGDYTFSGTVLDAGPELPRRHR